MRSRQARPSRRPSVAFAVALAVAALLVASGSAPCWAVLNDNTVKGAATHHVFSSSFGDSIDTLSGQLHFKIPIGPSFAVSDSFSYQLYLTYTSKVWRYNSNLYSTTPSIASSLARYRLDGRAQAGVGFYFQMGRIFWKWDGGPKLIVQLADGAEHDLTNGLVADDLSFIRADPLGGGQGYVVKTPDGIWYTMNHWVDDPRYDPNVPPDPGDPNAPVLMDGHWHDKRTTDVRGWYVTKIEQMGPWGEPVPRVEIHYGSTPRVDDHLMTRVTDVRGRNILFTNAACDAAAGLGCLPGESVPSDRWLPSAYVTEVRLPAFGVDDPNLINAAVFKLLYEKAPTTDEAIKLSFESPHVLDGEVFLRRLEWHFSSPVTGSYGMDFDYRADGGTGSHIGVVTKRTLPTRAEIQYDHGRYNFAVSAPLGSDCPLQCGLTIAPSGGEADISCLTCPAPGGDSTEEDRPATTGVTSKKVRFNPGRSADFDPNAPPRSSSGFGTAASGLTPSITRPCRTRGRSSRRILSGTGRSTTSRPRGASRTPPSMGPTARPGTMGCR